MQTIEKNGFLDIDIDPSIDLFAEIEKLKKEKNAIILAHYYQEPDIQDVADYIGDSLGLGATGRKNRSRYYCFCRCTFYGRNSQDIKSSKKVLLPDLNAGCSLSDSAPPPLV